jgi:hypothetical protein
VTENLRFKFRRKYFFVSNASRLSLGSPKAPSLVGNEGIFPRPYNGWDSRLMSKVKKQRSGTPLSVHDVIPSSLIAGI